LIQSFLKYFSCMSTHGRHLASMGLSAYFGFFVVDFLMDRRWMGTEWRYGM